MAPVPSTVIAPPVPPSAPRWAVTASMAATAGTPNSAEISASASAGSAAREAIPVAPTPMPLTSEKRPDQVSAADFTSSRMTSRTVLPLCPIVMREPEILSRTRGAEPAPAAACVPLAKLPRWSDTSPTSPSAARLPVPPTSMPRIRLMRPRHPVQGCPGRNLPVRSRFQHRTMRPPGQTRRSRP